MAGINFKAFDLGGHEIARRVWKDYYAKVRCVPGAVCCVFARIWPCASASYPRPSWWGDWL